MGEAAGQRLTNRVKAVFLEELAKTGNISAAARVASKSRTTVYEHKAIDPEFAAAWDDALEQATDRLELEARRRAHDGVEEPVFYQGVECGTVRKYSDTLMIQLLKAHHPAHRETIHRHKIGGDPDSPPVASVQTQVKIDADSMTEKQVEDARKLIHQVMQGNK